MTKPYRKLTLLTAAVLTAALFIGCAPSEPSDVDPGPIDIGMPLATAAPSASGAPTLPSTTAPGASASPDASLTPGASATPDSSATPGASSTPNPSATARPTSSIDASTITGTETIQEGKKLTYAEYKALNDDVVGWIKVKDTNVDYPVVQSHDNEEYLTLTPTLEESKAGSIFVDSHCSINGQYVVIHGHNMSKSKIMFAQLTNYGNRSFYDNHRTFELSIGGTTYTYKVFAVYTVDVGKVTDAKYMAFKYSSKAAFADYMNNTLATFSQFPVDTVIGEDDHVVTLSTCSHNGSGYDKNRFVVHAVRQ